MMMTKISIIDQRPMDSVIKYSLASFCGAIWVPNFAAYSSTPMATIFSHGSIMLALKIIMAM